MKKILKVLPTSFFTGNINEIMNRLNQLQLEFLNINFIIEDDGVDETVYIITEI
jgi:hypothetical protein